MKLISFLGTAFTAALMAALIGLAPLSAGAAELIIAQVAPFSGPLAPTGTHMRAGAQLYFDALNAAGGIHGAKIRLIAKDDGYKTDETVRLAGEMLKESQPLAFFGFVGTGNVEAVLESKLLAAAGIPLVAVRSGAQSLVRRNDPQLFMTRATYAAEVQKIVDQYATTGYNSFAIVYQDDAFGHDVLASAERAIKEAGGTLVATGSYKKNTTDVGAAVKAIAAAKPQAVIMIANTAASSEFLKQSREYGNFAQYVALSVTDAAQVVKRIGADKAAGLVLTQVVPDPNSPMVPLIKEIHDNFARFKPQNVTVNHTFVEGYLGAKVLAEALRRAGPQPTREKVREALETMKNYDAGEVFISFSSNRHTGSLFVDITILNQAGRLLR